MPTRGAENPGVPESTWQSRPAGDIVFATVPPYMATGWLAMGIPLLSALLEQAGFSSRIVRFGDAPHEAPPEILALAEITMWSDPPLPVRLARIRSAVDRNPEFVDGLLSRLLAGPERVFGFSVWRLNADVALEVARRLKQHRPDALVVFGGPESAESPEDLQQDWIDVVVRGAAEGVIVPVVGALLDRRPAEAAVWDNVWINPRHDPRTDVVRRRAEPPPLPRMDYTRIVPLQVGAPRPVLPVLLNLGCPFRCGFCTNTTVYPDLGWGSPQRVVEEMLEITTVWKGLHPVDQAPPLSIMFCDAALNAQPAQFDALCEGLIAADWPLRPSTIETMIIIDKRMTAQRVKLAMAANLYHTFFGLETANPRIRRVMKKPGQKEEVARALETCAEQGWRDSLIFGFMVGWPDETEEEFYETIRFLDWAISLGVMGSLSVSPMYRTPGMMDASLLRGAEGEKKGLAWRLASAAGSPLVRARRYFHVFEHFDGLVPVQSPVPHHMVVSRMMPDEPAGFWERWIATRGEHPVHPPQEPIESAAEEAAPVAQDEPPVAPDVVPADAPPWSERVLVGREVAVTLRLNPDVEAPALARAGAHGFSYASDTLPAPLRGVVLRLARALGRLQSPESPDDIWVIVARLLERIAPGVRLMEVGVGGDDGVPVADAGSAEAPGRHAPGPHASGPA